MVVHDEQKNLYDIFFPHQHKNHQKSKGFGKQHFLILFLGSPCQRQEM
jgi:hypothetical protein